MTEFHKPNSDIHFIIRGLVMCGDKIVLCRMKGKDWFFLPGGHVETGEPAQTTLIRELHEEMGDGDYKISSFVGICENIFSVDENLLQHEINIVFKVDVPDDFGPNSIEGHIEFVTVHKNKLRDYKILPEAIKDGLFEWFRDGKPFIKQL
jgi:8-oxo-dGTP diphosphatase